MSPIPFALPRLAAPLAGWTLALLAVAGAAHAQPQASPREPAHWVYLGVPMGEPLLVAPRQCDAGALASPDACWVHGDPNAEPVAPAVATPVESPVRARSLAHDATSEPALSAAAPQTKAPETAAQSEPPVAQSRSGRFLPADRDRPRWTEMSNFRLTLDTQDRPESLRMVRILDRQADWDEIVEWLSERHGRPDQTGTGLAGAEPGSRHALWRVRGGMLRAERVGEHLLVLTASTREVVPVGNVRVVRWAVTPWSEAGDGRRGTGARSPRPVRAKTGDRPG
ncbi:MAG: hypothetical protein LCH89_20540 [Proteobacteria bacterium]|jgi:hypothetical protein|nr:hypothetical protein [Pseudomonadota bacterium]